MKIAPLLFICLASAAFAQGQPPKLIAGPDAPLANDCQVLHTGDVYVRSENPANGPIEVFRCTQTGAISYGWMPIDHFVGPTLPPTCSTGAIAFQTGVTAGQNLFLCTANTWTAAATASAAGWTDDGTTISATAGRTVAVSSTGALTTPNVVFNAVTVLAPATANTGRILRYTRDTSVGACDTAGGGTAQTLCRSDGTNWLRVVEADASGSVAIGTTSLPTGVPINILTQGVRGDGTDETAAINAAIAAAAGKTLYFPAGYTYKATGSCIAIGTSNVLLMGAGFGASSSASILDLQSCTSPATITDASYVTITGLYIKAPNGVKITTSASFSKFNRIVGNRIEGSNPPAAGSVGTLMTGSSVYFNRVVDNTFVCFEAGVKTTSGANGNIVSTNVFEGMTRAGEWFSTDENVSIDNFVSSSAGFSTTLNGAINNSVTSLVVASTTGWPASGRIQIDSEVIAYASYTGTTLNSLTRGVSGTSAASHLDAASVKAPVTGLIIDSTAIYNQIVAFRLDPGTPCRSYDLASTTANNKVDIISNCDLSNFNPVTTNSVRDRDTQVVPKTCIGIAPCPGTYDHEVLGSLRARGDLYGTKLYMLGFGSFFQDIFDGGVKISKDDGLVQVVFHAVAPTTAGFGTTPAIAGNDSAGRITVGTGGDTTGTVTFGHSWGIAPVCHADNTTSGAAVKAVPSTTTLVLTGTFNAADVLTFSCVGY